MPRVERFFEVSVEQLKLGFVEFLSQRWESAVSRSTQMFHEERVEHHDFVLRQHNWAAGGVEGIVEFRVCLYGSVFDHSRLPEAFRFWFVTDTIFNRGASVRGDDEPAGLCSLARWKGREEGQWRGPGKCRGRSALGGANL